jgi:hypothetical protein
VWRQAAGGQNQCDGHYDGRNCGGSVPSMPSISSRRIRKIMLTTVLESSPFAWFFVVVVMVAGQSSFTVPSFPFGSFPSHLHPPSFLPVPFLGGKPCQWWR